MAFKVLLLRGARHETSIIDRLKSGAEALGLGIDVRVAQTEDEVADSIESFDAAFGYLSPELISRASRLRWVSCPQAGPNPSFYHQALIDSQAVVTNVRGIFSDHISAHIMSFVLAFSRGLHLYLARQRERQWEPGARTLYLPETRAVVVGLGGIGAETAKRCADFSMEVVGVDARVTDPPSGVSLVVGPERMLEVVADADFVIVTVPETPATQGLFNRTVFDAMREEAFFINIGRGATVVLDDLNAALRRGDIAGAALDVFETEPLPSEHPLWDAPGMMITPHVATVGPYLDDRRVNLFVENCKRFAAGEPLVNEVDKANWF